MSGHSKWATTKHQKAITDAKRAKNFTKLLKEITVAAKMGDPNPDFNPRLRNAVIAAKAASMPKVNIENAIKKATSSGAGENWEEIKYEGYGPDGIAIIVEALTDNRNRTAADVRHAFDRAGGNPGTTGCVSYLFDKKGVIIIDKTTTDLSEDDMMMLALENGAEDFEASEECYEITTSPADFSAVREALEQKGIEFLQAEIQMVPSTYVSLDEKGAEKMQRLIDALEDLDDVMNVYHNWEE